MFVYVGVRRLFSYRSVSFNRSPIFTFCRTHHSSCCRCRGRRRCCFLFFFLFQTNCQLISIQLNIHAHWLFIESHNNNNNNIDRERRRIERTAKKPNRELQMKYEIQEKKPNKEKCTREKRMDQAHTFLPNDAIASNLNLIAFWLFFLLCSLFIFYFVL